MTIQLDTIVARNDTILFSDLDNRMMMMSIDNGEYYSLDAVASRIWTLLVNPLSVADMCVTLVAEYEVSLEMCQQDILAFMNEMSMLEIVKVLNQRQ
ncbi:MAG: PqqD family peptide modification chaperone [Leptolyngbyaceae cyanobacterium MO_188.B28]|nr:PqqD family peptide modification chaperone [Leptolyngbyaceae cyanobacterium MO_188.B28]